MSVTLTDLSTTFRSVSLLTLIVSSKQFVHVKRELMSPTTVLVSENNTDPDDHTLPT